MSCSERTVTLSLCEAPNKALSRFNFESKLAHDATTNLQRARVSAKSTDCSLSELDVWKISAPDFRPHCYEPRPPLRNSQEAMKPWRYGSLSCHRDGKRQAPLKLPELLKEKPANLQDFISSIKLIGAWEAKAISARDKTSMRDRYINPKPHDFRGYPNIQSLGLPEFTTDQEPDPLKIKFLSQRLNVLNSEDSEDLPVRGEETDEKLAPLSIDFVDTRPKWQSSLILENEPFPNRFAGFTRHRPLYRSAHSALLERVQHRIDTEQNRRKMASTCLPGEAAVANGNFIQNSCQLLM